MFHNHHSPLHDKKCLNRKMSKVLVLGANGFIGSALCDAFVSEGFDVYGTTRSEETCKLLLQRGVTPVLVQSAQHVADWLPCARKCSLVIECIGDRENKATMQTIGAALVALLEERGSSLNVLYTTGIFSYGQDVNDPLRVFSEEDSYDLSFAVCTHRHAVEAAYRKAGAIAINAGMVYGAGAGPLFIMIGKAIAQSAKSNDESCRLRSCFGNGKQYLSTIHRLDLARLYVLVARQAHVLRGQLINAVAQLERYDSVAEAIAEALAYRGKLDYAIPDASDLKSTAYGGNLRVSGQKAKLLLGWIPKMPQFTAIARLEVAAFQSLQKQ